MIYPPRASTIATLHFREQTVRVDGVNRIFYEVTKAGFALICGRPTYSANLQWVLLYQEAFETFAAATSFETDRTADTDTAATVSTVGTVDVSAEEEGPKPGAEVVKVQMFDFEGSDVRVVTIGGEPHFVGKDVAERLGYADPTNAMKQHCKGVAKYHPLETAGGTQNPRVLAEPDVLRLIMGSNLPAAARFERWVFEDVLPSIRKHGAYIGGQEKMTDAELVAAAFQAANRISEERAKRVAALEGENAALAEVNVVLTAEASTLGAKVERLQPKAAAFDRLADHRGRSASAAVAPSPCVAIYQARKHRLM
jgi:anti-repressor protein